MFKSLSITQFLQEKLVSLLSNYLHDFSHTNISQLNLGLNTTLEMENLEIKEDILLKQSLPFVITEGKIGRITINIPVMFKNSPMKIEVENISIHIRPLVEQRSFGDKNKKLKPDDPTKQGEFLSIKSDKERKLAAWEKKVRNLFQEQSKPGFAKKIVDSIISNMSISIKNLNIYYENFSVLNTPTFVKISLREINVQSTDKNWVPSFNPSLDKQYRTFEVKGLAVSLNVGSEGHAAFQQQYKPSLLIQKGRAQTQSLSSVDEHKRNYIANEKVRYFVDENEALEAEFRKLRDRESFVLLPLHLTFRMQREKVLSKNRLTHEMAQQIWIDTYEPIILMLNKNHMRFLGALSQHLHLINIVQKNIHLRPLNLPKERPNLWWNYAIKAVIEERKRQTKFDRSSSNALKMRKYVNLYKRKQNLILAPWLMRLNEKDMKAFEALEDQIPVQSLIAFRELALVEIKSEAKRMGESAREAFNQSQSEEYDGPIPDELRQMFDPNSTSTATFLHQNHSSTDSNLKLQLLLDIKSVYVLITEPKEASNALAIDNRRFNLSSVQQWRETTSASGSYTPQNRPVIRSLGNISTTPKHNKSNSLPPEIQEESDGSFYTAQDNTIPDRPSDVSMSRFPDILIDEEEDSKTETSKGQKLPQVPTQDNINWNKKTTSQESGNLYQQNLEGSWNQNLILIIEVLQIRGMFCQLYSGKVITKKPLEIQSLMITTAMNMPIALEERNQRLSSSFEKYLKYETLMQYLLALNFESILGSEDEHPFLRFLRENNCNNFAVFFEVFLKDHQDNGRFVAENFDAYLPFFDKNSVFFLDFPPEITRKFHACLTNEYTYNTMKEEVIWDAFYALEEHVNKDMLPHFFYTSGVIVLPLLLQTFALPEEQILSIIANKVSEEEAKVFLDRMKGFYYKPRQASMIRFIPKEKKKNIKSKKTSFQPLLSLSLNLIKTETNGEEGAGAEFVVDLKQVEQVLADSPTETQQQEAAQYGTLLSIDLQVKPITLYLSPECFRSLILFIKSFPTKKAPKPSTANQKDDEEGIEPLTLKEYDDLLQCVENEKEYRVRRRYENSPEVNVKFDNISIKFFNFSSYYLGERRLNFELKDISFRIKRPLEPEFSLPQEQKKLESIYQQTHMRIGSLELNEAHWSEHESSNIQILKTKIIVSIYNCIYKNHIQHDDQKVHVLIPFFKLHIDDNIPLFCEIIKSFQQTPSVTQGFKKFTIYPDVNIFTMLSSTDLSYLNSKLRALQKEHKPTTVKNCNHCILFHKKSKLVMNFFIGNLLTYFKGLDNTPFSQLYFMDEEDLGNKEQFSGFLITFKQSLAPKEMRGNRTIIHLPLLALTRDLGFFKDTVVIHSTEINAEESNYSPQHADAMFSKLGLMVRAKRDFATYLDDSFWAYFLSIENKFRKKDPSKSSSEKFSSPPKSYQSSGKYSMIEGSKEDDENVFVLFFRRRYRNRGCLRELEINGEKKVFRNSTALLIKEISIQFSSLYNFMSLINTFDTLGLVNKWLEQMMYGTKAEEPHQTSEEHEKKKHKKKVISGVTSNKIRKALNEETLLIMIEKISFSVHISLPKIRWEVEMNHLMIENTPEQASHPIMILSTNDSDSVELLSIKKLSFKATQNSNAYIQGISLRINKTQGGIDFSIDKICYEAPVHKKQPLIETPPPSMDSRSKSSAPKKALEVHFSFHENFISKIEILLSPVNLYFDSVDLCEEFASINMFQAMLGYQRGEIPELLARFIFEKEQFEKILDDLRKRKVQQALQKKEVKHSNPKFGPFAAQHSFSLSLKGERISLFCIKDDIAFINLTIRNVEVKMDVKGEYRVMIKTISLSPYDSYYDDFFADLSPTQKMKIEIYKEGAYPVIEAQQGKLVFMNRVLIEFKRFRKNQRLDMVEACKKVLKSNYIYEKSLEKKAQVKADIKTPKKQLVKIRIRDGCLIVPRTTISKDALVCFLEGGEVTVDLETLTLNIPTPLTEEFIIMNRNQILREEDTFQQVIAAMFVADVKLIKGEAFYIIGDRRVHLGQSDRVNVSVLAPDRQVTKDNWIFDLQVKLELGSFLATMNMASIDEVKNLMLNNLKEPSKVFPQKLDNFENVQMTIVGKKLAFGMNKSNIVAERVEELKNEQKGKIHLKEDEDIGFEDHLDEVVTAMKAMRKY